MTSVLPGYLMHFKSLRIYLSAFHLIRNEEFKIAPVLVEHMMLLIWQVLYGISDPGFHGHIKC